MTLNGCKILIIALILFDYVSQLVMTNWIKSYTDLFHISNFTFSENQAAWLQVFLLTILSFFAGVNLDSHIIEFQLFIRNTIFLIAAILTWKSVTADYDIVYNKKNVKARVLLIILTISLYYYPSLLLPYLFVLINFFGAWVHHAMMPIRILKMSASYWGSLVVIKHITLVDKIDFSNIVVPFLLLILCVQASHYFIPGMGKLQLGEKWNSWILENETHYLIVSAYNWGWLQFLPEVIVVNIVNIIKVFNKFINSYTIIFQCGLFALLANSSICLLLLTGCTVLNIGIFFTTGIFFWEYILTNIFIILLISHLNNNLSLELFSSLNWFIYLVILFLPLNGKLWIPYSMSWWDTPFTGRVHWCVVGKSGKTYGLYNNFMCPFEHLYGRTYGYFLVEHKILHDHLGIVWKNKELRDQIIASKGDLQILSNLKNQFGQTYRDSEQERQHEFFLINFFSNLNCGVDKNILPSWLKWLKAPGGYFYYWGDYPAYNRQEPISSVVIYYKEKYFDGNEIKLLVDERVKIVEIPPHDNNIA